MEPSELTSLINSIRECKVALGSPVKHRTAEEESTASALRRSLVATKNLGVGEIISENSLAIMRPGTGLQPEFYEKILGKKITRPVLKGMPLTLDDLIDGD